MRKHYRLRNHPAQEEGIEMPETPEAIRWQITFRNGITLSGIYESAELESRGGPGGHGYDVRLDGAKLLVAEIDAERFDWETIRRFLDGLTWMFPAVETRIDHMTTVKAQMKDKETAAMRRRIEGLIDGHFASLADSAESDDALRKRVEEEAGIARLMYDIEQLKADVRELRESYSVDKRVDLIFEPVVEKAERLVEFFYHIEQLKAKVDPSAS